MAGEDDDLLDSFTPTQESTPSKRPIKFSRVAWFPSSNTFTIPPIANFVERWLAVAPSRQDAVVIDPFARNSVYGTITNDLNPNTAAQHHMDARDFLDMLIVKGVQADVVILDPPYSPHQIKEMYQGIGLKVGTNEVQIAAMFKHCKNKLTQILRKDGVALSFGWSSAGFSDRRGFETHEIMLVYHGAGRNDTICVAERKLI